MGNDGCCEAELTQRMSPCSPFLSSKLAAWGVRRSLCIDESVSGDNRDGENAYGKTARGASSPADISLGARRKLKTVHLRLGECERRETIRKYRQKLTARLAHARAVVDNLRAGELPGERAVREGERTTAAISSSIVRVCWLSSRKRRLGLMAVSPGNGGSFYTELDETMFLVQSPSGTTTRHPQFRAVRSSCC